ncbi:hypothetical protein Tco_1313124 [Tanacetum coccineum]
MGDENPIRTLGDYSKPSHEGYRNTIKLPVGNNMVPLRSDTIRLVQNGCSFHRLRSEDPNQHLKDFLKLVDSLDLNSENWERTRLQSLSEAWTRLKDLLQKLPHYGIELWLQAILEDLALYDNESWNDLRDFAKPVKAITLPQDGPSTSDRRLIELENQVQRLMDAYLASTQLTQVNKITASCEICNGPHDTHNCKEGPKQACVDYASLHANEIRGKSNQIKLEKSLLDFDSNKEERLSHLRTQLEQQQDYMIGKINLLWKTVSEILNDTSPPKNTGNSIAPKSITAISHDEKEELRKKGIKRPSKLLSPKYLSPASIEELNKNPLSPKRIHFVNLIVMLSIDSNTKEEDDSSTNACNLNLGGMVKGNEEVIEKGNDEDEMETIMEVEEVFEEEESEFETEQEIEEIFEDEEEDVDDENFNSFLTMKELSHHEWLLNNPRPPWVKAKVRAGSPNNIKISCMVGINHQTPYDPLALMAHTCPSSRHPLAYYVTHPPSVVDYDDDYQGDEFQSKYEDPLTFAMMLLARPITQRFSNLTNNRLRTSSNTRNQAIVQADRVNIQRRNSGNDGRNTRRSYVQEEIMEGDNVQNDVW